MRRNFGKISAIALLICASVCPAQDYPTRPIRIIVPSTAGGSVDTLARTVAAPMQLPTGALMALIGAPVLLALLWKREHGH